MKGTEILDVLPLVKVDLIETPAGVRLDAVTEISKAILEARTTIKVESQGQIKATGEKTEETTGLIATAAEGTSAEVDVGTRVEIKKQVVHVGTAEANEIPKMMVGRLKYSLPS